MNVSVPSSKNKKSIILMSGKMPTSFMKASITKGPQESVRGFFKSFNRAHILSYLYSRRQTYPDVDVTLFHPLLLSSDSKYPNGSYIHAVELRLLKGKRHKTFFFRSQKEASTFAKNGDAKYITFAITPSIIISEDDIYIHPYAKQQIIHSKKKLVVCYLQLRRYNKEKKQVTGHANMLMFDKVNQQVYRFEPHGAKANRKQAGVSKRLTKFIKKETNFSMKPLDSTCPYLGPQAKANAFTGMCLTWTALVTHVYLMNFKKMSLKKVQEDLLKYFTKDQLLTMIMKYNRHISKYTKSLKTT